MSTDSRDQLLISRIVDGDAGEPEWTEFETLAIRQPLVWRELAEAQRDHAALVRGVSSALALAEATPLPSSREAFNFQGHADKFQQRLHRLSAWAGWAVAAVVVLAFTPLGRPFQSSPPQSGLQTTGWNINTADDALDAYKKLGGESGRVLGEMPTRVMVQSTPVPTGQGYEVVYLRQIVEKVIVADLYQFTGEDERGQPTPVRWQQKQRGSM